eukprot:CAMPEP_0172441968 /NCGR_PEP_ID=MMETSP1065-20121228/2464_1 /TAXON_ID=265537 /ORGANISM="Amphiprora paludosa, Strain CCMP125" /LENGTH=349 /DNA_ID=CAMNT_0013191607 /DNA_START=45 /DNA_END=1094 /DNA_ORIENTATION=-
MTFQYLSMAVAFLWTSQQVQGFSILPFSSRTAAAGLTDTSLPAIRCEDKFYQLEEREDKECITTELFLLPNRVIDFGETDGPMPIATSGTWDVQPGTDNYSMLITRKFASGKEGTDMGEFEFETVREFKGEMTMVGESVAITGVMISKDDLLGDEEVGFFNMIDGTKERESYALDGRFNFEVDETKGLKLSDKFGSVENLTPPPLQPQSAQPAVEYGPPDPQEVLNVVPSPLATALHNQDLDALIEAAATCFSCQEESDYYLKMCNDAGLWNNPTWPVRQDVAAAPPAPPAGAAPRLDPEYVLNHLPPAMSHAFRTQNMDRLTAALASMSKEDADYYMQQCIDAGLWNS